MISKYAQVTDGRVRNIAVFETREDAIRITHAIYGAESEAVDVDDLNVYLGAAYRDGKFYNVAEDGTETEAEEIPTIRTLSAQLQETTLALAMVIGGALDE